MCACEALGICRINPLSYSIFVCTKRGLGSCVKGGIEIL